MMIVDARDFVFYDGDEDADFDLDGPHSDICCCEDCLQNHPERDVLYNDSQYYGDDDEDFDDGEG